MAKKYRIIKRTSNLNDEWFHIQRGSLFGWEDVTIGYWSETALRYCESSSFRTVEETCRHLKGLTEHVIKEEVIIVPNTWELKRGL